MAKLDHQVFAVLFVILCVLWMSKGAKYHMLLGNYTMAGAPDKCQLATPELIYTENGIRLNMTTDEFFPDEGGTFWTGYVKVFQAFQYRGCVLMSDIAGNITRQQYMRNETSPGTCYSFCNTSTIIGLSGWTCYCLPSSIQSTTLFMNQGCAEQCRVHNGALCGILNKTFVSVYEKVKYFPSTTNSTVDDQILCLAWNADMLEYTWSNCSNAHRYVCQQAESDTFITFSLWSTIMQQCLKDNYLPALRLTNFTRTRWTAGTTLWIGEVRDKTIAMGSNHTKSMILQRGYAELQDKVFHLRFDDDTKQHSVMCYREGTTAGSSTSTTISTRPTDEIVIGSKTTTGMPYNATISTDTSIIQTDETVTRSKTTTDMPYNTTVFTGTSIDPADETVTRSMVATNMPDNPTVTPTARYEATTIDESTKNGNFLPLIVGVSIGVPVLVMLIVIVICVVKRRNKTNKKVPENEIGTRDELQTEHNNASAATERYFVLEPIGNRPEIAPVGDVVYDTAEERAPQDSDTRVYNRPESDGTYNVTTDSAAKGKQPNENLYNKTEADDTYDHTGAAPEKHPTDNVYNMTEPGDIYNQAFVFPVRKVQTDNVYNMTETDDTYRLTDSKPKSAAATDNVYN